MLIEKQMALAEVLPWLWPLVDEDSGCAVEVDQSSRMRLLAALIAVPEATDNALGGKVRSCVGFADAADIAEWPFRNPAVVSVLFHGIRRDG